MKPFPITLLFLSLLFFSTSSPAQDKPDLLPVIDKMCELESRKDAKCHATASRLEDFIYGTPLSFSARNKRIEFQKRYVKAIWEDYTQKISEQNTSSNSIELFEQLESKYFKFSEDFLGISLYINEHKIFLTERDYRQYSSIAYALRAILSVQQSNLFEAKKLANLDEATIQRFKKSVDMAVLALLSEADEFARNENKYQIEEKHIQFAIDKLFPSLTQDYSKEESAVIESSPIDQKTILYDIIEKKLAAYQNYNQISQKVFLRNIQVYFSKIPWPKDSEKSNSLRNFYTESMVQLSGDMLLYAEQLAIKQNKPTIEYEDVYQAVQVYLPHTINMFEDVSYFPNLGSKGEITIEAYDLDAFRDSGLHWQYLKFALDDRQTDFKAVPDAFALEMLVEGIAQFAVLVFREAGNIANQKEKEALEYEDVLTALQGIQQKINNYPTTKLKESKSDILSVKTSSKEDIHSPFTQVTKELGIDFNHRNSDWLNRIIRSYLVKEDENLARLSIPPAFGGGGVAAEDINNDGWEDILLLGGRGNKLLINNQGKGFKDITQQSGIYWQRPDGNFGEPRQPIVADFDNDGLPDIFISYANDLHHIFKNLGNGKFKNMTEVANLGGMDLIGGPCTALDFNNDGLLDIYIGYFGNYLKGELPTLKRHNTNGSPNKLFRNLGNFQFEDVSEGSGVQNAGWTQAVGHADINRDGWQDLIVGNDFGTNSYYINQKDGTFKDVSSEIGTDKPSYTMNVGIGDLNRDMHPDFYISNIVVMEKDDKYVLPNEDTKAHFDPSSLSTMRVVEANDLFISNSDSKDLLTYRKSTNVGRGYGSTGWSWDADFFDYDNDGDEDLYCLTGMNPYSVYGQENEYYKSPEGASKEVIYAKSQEESNIFFENKNGQLEVYDMDQTLSYSGTSRSAAYLDYDNDGDLDIVVNDYQGAAKLFKNNSEQLTNSWAKIKLVGAPENGINQDAIGTSITMTTNDGQIFWKEVYSTIGYLSVHPKNIHFGLGKATQFDIELIWSNGKKQIVKGLNSNQKHTINYNPDK